MQPEAAARQKIDALLVAAGWVVQDYKAFSPAAGRGIALREVPLTSGRCDYLLLVDRIPLGVIEDKKEGTALSTVSEQSAHYGENRLTRLDQQLNHRDTEALRKLTGGQTLGELAKNLLNAFDPDVIAGRARPPGGPSELTREPTPAELESARKSLLAAACAPFENNVLRDALAKAKQDAEQTIDTITIDKVEFAGFDAAAKARAQSLVQSFRAYVEQQKAEITALQILYSRPYAQRLTEPMLKELEQKLPDTDATWTEENPWRNSTTRSPLDAEPR